VDLPGTIGLEVLGRQTGGRGAERVAGDRTRGRVDGWVEAVGAGSPRYSGGGEGTKGEPIWLESMDRVSALKFRATSRDQGQTFRRLFAADCFLPNAPRSAAGGNELMHKNPTGGIPG